MRFARPAIVMLSAALAACGNGDGGGIQVETAWCDDMLDSDVMARSLRGELPGETVAQAKQHCVLIPVGTPYDVVDEQTNVFGQTYLKAEVVRPDTGETEALWVRKIAAGLK